MHSRLEIVSNRLAILRMTELISQDDSDDEAAQIIWLVLLNLWTSLKFVLKHFDLSDYVFIGVN